MQRTTDCVASVFCIVAGIPGIGKTTLAEVLLTDLVDRHGFSAYRVTHDLSELQSIKNPKSKQAFELYQDYFKRQKRAAWPQVLVAERAYFEQKEHFLEALIAFRRAEVAINGLLLVDGLNTPFAVGGQGHIESVAKPR